jgi:hypothetical protein
MSDDRDRSLARVENLTRETRTDRALDTLAGGVVRLFASVADLERLYRDERAARVALAADVSRLQQRLARPTEPTKRSEPEPELPPPAPPASPYRPPGRPRGSVKSRAY